MQIDILCRLKHLENALLGQGRGEDDGEIRERSHTAADGIGEGVYHLLSLILHKVPLVYYHHKTLVVLLDKLEDVLTETPKVRKDLGYPPLVTPMSQMVGVQAVSNVLAGERYKNVSKEVKAYLKGEYGTAPGEIDTDLIKKVLGDEEPMKNRFADTLEPAFEKTKAQLKGIAKSDKDVLSYIAFPQIAEKFFKEREEREVSKVTYTIVKK